MESTEWFQEARSETMMFFKRSKCKFFCNLGKEQATEMKVELFTIYFFFISKLIFIKFQEARMEIKSWKSLGASFSLFEQGTENLMLRISNIQKVLER